MGVGRTQHGVSLWSVEVSPLMPSKQDAPRSTDITVYVRLCYKNFFAPLSHKNTQGKKNVSSESQNSLHLLLDPVLPDASNLLAAK